MDILDMMKVKPLVLPMHPAEFLAFVRASLENKDLLDEYREKTGNDPRESLPRTPLEIAVAMATDHTSEKMALAKFMDWLAIWYWGVEGCICDHETERVNDDCPFHAELKQ